MYQVKRLSKYRTVVNNVLRMSLPNSYPIHMNTQVDIESLLEFKKSKKLGMNAILTKAIADTIVDNPKFKVLGSVLQKNILGQKLVVFDHVSFSIAIDTTYEDEMVASTYLLENVDCKSLEEVDKELTPINNLKASELPVFKLLKFLLPLPSWMQRSLFYLNSMIPRDKAITLGSIGFSNLGKGSIHSFFPLSPKTIMFGIGGTHQRVVLKDEKAINHTFLTINITFNHFVVDGKICSEFLTSLKQRLEAF
ncbi:MAG: 2-oxo acid dehydrogenase subunit E2 [Bacteriovoracaceae bacterium]|nr:2-oxo acid dehydrogenase subunit E2 [Bacteriovoracaceae bacterium]